MPLHKRRLGDLWITGRELTLDDDSGEEPVTVWIQKLNPLDQAEASRKADAARARYLGTKQHPESDEWLQQYSAVLNYGEDRRIIAMFLLGEMRNKLQVSCASRISAQEKWSKDNYLQGLFDLWNDKFHQRWLNLSGSEEEDPEAQEVYEELATYNAEVDTAVGEELEPHVEVRSEEPLEDLRIQMVERMIDIDGGQLWLDEYHRHQIFLGTFDLDDSRKSGRHFETRHEVDVLATRTFRDLRNAFDSLEVDPNEGKSSPVPPSSSTSSAQPEEPAMEDSSGPMAVSA